MSVKYFAPKVTETMYHWFFLLEITVVKIMNNLNVCSAHSYLYPRSRFKTAHRIATVHQGSGSVRPNSRSPYYLFALIIIYRVLNEVGGGVMVFCFVQNFFFGQHELEYLFILSRKARNFLPEFNIRLHDKNSESDFFFFPSTIIRIFFSATLGISIFFFLEKNITPLQVKWSFFYSYQAYIESA